MCGKRKKEKLTFGWLLGNKSNMKSCTMTIHKLISFFFATYCISFYMHINNLMFYPHIYLLFEYF